MNKLPEVKRFINQDLPLFHNVEFKNKPGAPPNLVLLNKDGNAVERIDLSPLSEEECNALLLSKGFFKKSDASTPVPEKYLTGPYLPVGNNAETGVKVGKTEENQEL